MAEDAGMPDVKEFTDAGGNDDFEFDAKVGEDQQLTPDGGVVKKIIAAGDGWDKPETGDEVSVHYVGTLEDGTKFDSSRERGDPFKFNLGKGAVIKGWDIGVASMLKGEKSLLICKADYAYGERGSPPKIPAGATLHFEVELLSWKSVKDIAGDGGVIKTVVTEGSGWGNPKPRDEVLVRYEIRVKGSSDVVASSPADGAEFPAEAAAPLRAFGTALPGMKEGEKAHLIIRHDYGFSVSARPAGVAADAELEADLELVSWKSIENVTDDGAVFKKTLVKSSDWKKPNAGAKVTAKLVGRLPDGTVFEDQQLEFVTDEEQVPEGLDLAVQKMKKGETAEVTISPKYGFGAVETQRPQGIVPANSTVIYTVELLDFENAKESWSMSDEEKVEEGRKRKEKGNARFKQGNWAGALKRYKGALDLVESDGNFSDALRSEAREVRKGCLLNMAACHTKLGSNREAIKSVDKILEKDGGNVKALYRRAQARLALGELVEAQVDLKRALSEDPSNTGVRALYKEYKQKEAENNKKDRALFSRMFKPSKDPAAAPVSSSAAAPVSSSAEVDATLDKAQAVAAAAQGLEPAEATVNGVAPAPMDTDAPAANGTDTA